MDPGGRTEIPADVHGIRETPHARAQLVARDLAAGRIVDEPCRGAFVEGLAAEGVVVVEEELRDGYVVGYGRERTAVAVNGRNAAARHLAALSLSLS